MLRPDGREFVGLGIDPDVLVQPTQGDICTGRDPVLDEAMRILTPSH